tara:strand:+ start:7112 stop:7996 length:885 start_codon:yes stop_codon:yes gene_type:complete
MKILTIDGNNLVHRVYWVANNMATKSENMHVYMFLNSVKSYVEMFKPDKVFCVWDEKKDYTVNKRKELLKEYKGNRDKDYAMQVHQKNELIKEFLQTLGIPSVYPQSYEADDVIKIINDAYDAIATSKFYLTKKLFRHIIVTVDRDLCQLISSKVSIYDPIRKVDINEGNFEEILKYPIKDFVKVKALTGDKSDNIPGIKGFGKVKIDKFLKGDVVMTEEENEQYKKNLKLVTLTNDTDEINYVKEQLNTISFDKDYEKFQKLCKEFNFKQVEKSHSKWYTAFFQENRLLELLS